MHLNNYKNSPFPINLNKYNEFSVKEDLIVYIPYKSQYPFIFIDKKLEKNAFIYAENLQRVTIEILFNFNYFDDIYELIDIIKFQRNQNKINMVVFNNSDSETSYYLNIKGRNYLQRCFKIRFKENKQNLFWVLDLENHNKYQPIEKRIISGKVIENYFYISPEDHKLYHSYNPKDDKPFQITKYIDGDDYYYEKDYLIPNIKNKRISFYRPSFIITKNNKLIDYEYIINGRDFTEKAKKALETLNIKDPNSHLFTTQEKQFLKNILTF